MTRLQLIAILFLLVLLTASLAPAATAQDPPRPLGCLFTAPQPHLVRQPPRDGLQPAPTVAAVDLSADLPPVGDQGAQPSCVAWATAYYFKTYQEKRERGSLTTLSPAYAFNQIYITYAGGVAAYVGDALDLLVNQGCAPWDQFPYQDSDYQTQPTYEQRRAALPYQSADYGAFFLSNLGDPRAPTPANNDLAPLKASLAGGAPVVLVIPIYAEFDAPAGPHAIVDVPANTLTFRGGHAVLLVGYDDAIGGFKYVNSWGTAYGDHGFGYLTYDFVRYYGSEAWWMTDRLARGPHSLCGHARNVAGVPLADATLTLDDALTVTTSADGFYGWGGLAAGGQVARPAKPGYTFEPEARWVDVAGAMQGIDFVGTSPNTSPLDCAHVIDARMGGRFTGDTAGAPFNVHQYSCADWNESGPEHVYRVISNRAGVVSAALYTASADLDVFILAACDEATCLAAGNTFARVANAPAGVYYVVADGYNGAHGAYTLDISAPWYWDYYLYLPLILRSTWP